MTCNIIRDLLPLYDTNKCRKETKEIVTEHLKTCESCRELYEVMHEEVGLKKSIEIQSKPAEDNEFWCKYYGELLKKYLIIFFVVYIFLIGIKVIIK
jgi:predicted anti-sigma-YlaC factor YlaD